ncbi:hypothetical protein [Streptomyces sp. NPDC007100]|uniref:hypothetical protein n=1 Tax=Streptomyces sp. NPDC007100 TaxID=3155602 RepID=UPI00340DC12F
MSERLDTAALDTTAYRAAFGSLRQIVAQHMADALVQGDDAEHRRTVRLARGLDEAGLNLDAEIDAYISGNHDARPKWAWKSPAARKEHELPAPWDVDEPPF